MQPFTLICSVKAVKYRDTVSVTKDTSCMSDSLETVSVSESPTRISCIGNSVVLCRAMDIDLLAVRSF